VSHSPFIVGAAALVLLMGGIALSRNVCADIQHKAVDGRLQKAFSGVFLFVPF
jgi:hypothetical protein